MEYVLISKINNSNFKRWSFLYLFKLEINTNKNSWSVYITFHGNFFLNYNVDAYLSETCLW